MPDAMVPLATTVLVSAVSSVTFTVPSGYRDLRLVVVGTYSVHDTAFEIYLNGDSNVSNYSNVFMGGNGSTASSWTANNHIEGGWYTYPNTGGLGMSVVNIMDYAATDKHKTVLSRADTAAGSTRASAGRWASNAAVTTITVQMPAYLSPVFNAGSTFSLYGVIA